MELRLLTTHLERRTFLQRLHQARARHGGIYREVCHEQIDNRARLACSLLYGLFEHEADGVEGMIAGLAIHDLKTFPQSCREPDLTHLPPAAIIECGDHWSLSLGAGMRVWHGAAVQVVRLRPRAVLAYLAVGPSEPNHFGFYAAMGFTKTGAPVEYPYVEGLDGHRPLVQPMVLQGQPFRDLVAGVARMQVDALDNYRIVRFNSSLRLRPCVANLTRRNPDPARRSGPAGNSAVPLGAASAT
ncbi:MAG: hypothetical protein M0038_14735 [Pseudomonadota bacterium]|jgi:hypothetical protein|nr:hypothetical protein [Pseudomonadota bacterium]